MNIFLCLLLIVLVIATTGRHAYYVWKRKDYTTFVTQIGIVVVTIIAGVFIIYDVSEPSVSKLLNMLSPFER